MFEARLKRHVNGGVVQHSRRGPQVRPAGYQAHPERGM